MLLAIENLTVAFGETRVLHGVDISIRKGEALGLVGESGSGKSVTFLAALGLLPKSAKVTGRALLDGRDILGAAPQVLDGVRGHRVAMIFQDPASALNPVLTIRRQLSEALALHRGLSGRALQSECKRLLDLVGIPDAERRLSAYPHEFSGGQNQRIMIAMALAGNPDLLIADEPTTALDVTIQAQILELLARLRAETGMAMVLISHDLGVVSEHCDRVAVMYAGRVVETAPASVLFEDPSHPYSSGLIGALPPLDGPRRRLTAVGGTVPDPRDMPPGCAFAPRCSLQTVACRMTAPPLLPTMPGRDVACYVASAHRQFQTGQAAE
jgi:peptide/nickel transport system ATP-binding protein